MRTASGTTASTTTSDPLQIKPEGWDDRFSDVFWHGRSNQRNSQPYSFGLEAHDHLFRARIKEDAYERLRGNAVKARAAQEAAAWHRTQARKCLHLLAVQAVSAEPYAGDARDELAYRAYIADALGIRGHPAAHNGIESELEDEGLDVQRLVDDVLRDRTKGDGL